MRSKSRSCDAVLGILSMLAGIVILILTKVQNLELVKSGQMGPGFFPTICGIAILVCGLLILVELSLKVKRAKKDPDAAGELEKQLFDLKELRNLLLFFLLGSGVLLLTEYLGLLTCLGLSVLAYLKVQGRESWLKAAVISVCMVAFLYVVFVLFLRVPVPKGPLGF